MRAFLFPGQGAQEVGMGKDFYDLFPVAREAFQEADDLLSYSLSKEMFFGDPEQLKDTRYSQLALFVHSIALMRTLREQMPSAVPDVCAGLSLGEYTALCASGRASFAETLLLVRHRAELMYQACRKNEGTMAAVLGLSSSEVEESVKRGACSQEVWVANYNCPRQIVISGTKQGVGQAMVVLKEAGAKRVVPLQVDGAFHSPLMRSAQEGLAPLIRKTPLQDSAIKFVMNVSGTSIDSPEEVRINLIEQVVQPVRWEQGIQTIDTLGEMLYLEIGCGTSLQGMNKKIVPHARTVSLSKVADLDQIAEVL